MGRQGEEEWAERTLLWSPCAHCDGLRGDADDLHILWLPCKKSEGSWEGGRMEMMFCKTSCLKHFVMMEVSATVIVAGRAGLLWDCYCCCSFETWWDTCLAQGAVEDVDEDILKLLRTVFQNMSTSRRTALG